MRTRAIAAAATLAAGATFRLAGPAAAAPPQSGLVNVDVTDLAVQAPIGVAANICDVNVAVLVSNPADEADRCDATADDTATITPA